MTSQQLQTRRTWSARRIVLTAVGVVAMAAAVVLGWGVVYVLGAVALVVGVWPLARRVTPRIGPAVFVLIVLVAVGLPAYQAWRLYDGDARASLQVPTVTYDHAGGLLYASHIDPEIVVAADGSVHPIRYPETLSRVRDEGRIDHVSPGVGAVVSTDQDLLWFTWAVDEATDAATVIEWPAGYDNRTAHVRVKAMTESAVVFSFCTEETDNSCLVAGYDTSGTELWRLEDQVRTRIVRDAIPAVVVTGDGPFTVRDPATGEPLGEYPGERAVLVGDLLVAAQPDGETCHLTAGRGSDVEWEATVTTSECETPRLTDGYAIFAGDDPVVIVDLDDGRPYTHPAARWESWDEIVGGTAVLEDGNTLVGLDIRTGQERWRQQPDDWYDYEVGAGQVLLVTHPRAWNPFIPREVREEGFVFELLDAETGETRARVLYPDPVDAVQLIDGGLAVTFDHDVMTVYGDPPDPRP